MFNVWVMYTLLFLFRFIHVFPLFSSSISSTCLLKIVHSSLNLYRCFAFRTFSLSHNTTFKSGIAKVISSLSLLVTLGNLSVLLMVAINFHIFSSILDFLLLSNSFISLRMFGYCFSCSLVISFNLLRCKSSFLKYSVSFSSLHLHLFIALLAL